MSVLNNIKNIYIGSLTKPHRHDNIISKATKKIYIRKGSPWLIAFPRVFNSRRDFMKQQDLEITIGLALWALALIIHTIYLFK